MKYLYENIQGCVLGYAQSDEITLILIDYKNLNSSAWFDYEVQKMCSIAASMTTIAFNKFFEQNVFEFDNLLPSKIGMDERDFRNIAQSYETAINKGAMFDARCFNIPKEEVTNLIYWRQADATRNSIQMVGQANFSHKELQNKTCNTIQDMLMTEKGINWNDFPTHQKRGSCCIKEEYYPEPLAGYEDCPIDATSIRTRWVIDEEIPIFKGEDRNYIDKLIKF